MNIKPFHDLIDFPGANPRLREIAAIFAKETREAWPNIASTYPLPEAIWKRAGESGVTGIGIDEAFGGLGGTYEDIAASAAEISFFARSPGLALSFFIHQLVARFAIATLASEDQKNAFLPNLATGKITASLAVSEPDTGGNPKLMKTRAERKSSGWVLAGEKTFVTNAPIAGLFVTLAVTGEKNGRKEFSAFLVPAKSPGVQVRDIGSLPFLNPAPHGAISFKEVEFPENALLGKEGAALEFLSRSFVKLEDVLMAGSLVGGFSALLMCLCRDLVRTGRNTPEKTRLAGKLEARITALASLAAHGAERTALNDFAVKSEGFNRAIRDLCLLILALFNELAKDVPMQKDTETLFNDLEKSGTIGGQRAKAREEKAGKEILSVFTE